MAVRNGLGRGSALWGKVPGRGGAGGVQGEHLPVAQGSWRAGRTAAGPATGASRTLSNFGIVFWKPGYRVWMVLFAWVKEEKGWRCRLQKLEGQAFQSHRVERVYTEKK